jgi:uncharacterized protein (DUF1697 family)
MARYVALLRGINLGATRRVSMPDLRALLTERGYQDVATLVQSGNVVLSTPVKAAELPARLEGELADAFGLDIPVLVRTRAQLAEVVEADPFAGVATEPKRYYVTFFAAKPPAAALKAVLDRDWGAEQVTARGREIYAWHPDGLQSSKLARAIGAERLGSGTARNWNTVTGLLELASG